MADKFNIVVDGDITPFERKISQIENRIKRMREFGPSGTYSQLSQQYKEQGNTQKSQKMDEYRQRAGSQNRRQMARDLKTQEDLIKKNEAAQQRVTNSLGNTLKTQENINRAKELQIKLEEKHLSLAKSIGEMKGQMMDRGPGMGPFSGRDMTFIKRGMEGGRGLRGGVVAAGRAGMRMMGPGSLGVGLGMVGSAVQTGSEMTAQLMRYPERISKREATTAGMLSEAGRLQSQRKLYELEYYRPERKAALEKASTSVTAAKIEDAGSLIGTAGKIVGGGLMIAGGIAAAPFTAGTSLPAAAGGVAALAGGAHLMASGRSDILELGTKAGDRKRSMIFDREAYGKEMDAIFSGTYQDQLAAEKTKRFDKVMAADFFQKNSERFIGLQRQFGLSDKDLFSINDKGESESIFQKATKAGYSMDEVGKTMQGINQAGGSTEVSKGGGLISAQMQRNLDLTNAPQLMGKVSGYTGMGANESKDALIRMYAEATKMGMDASEVRSLMQTSVDMAAQTGGSLDVTQGLLGAGVGDLKNPFGIKASADALQDIKNKTRQMGGMVGQYQMAEFGSKEITESLGGTSLTFGERAYLAGSDPTKFDENSDYIKGLFLERNKDNPDYEYDPEAAKKFLKLYRQAEARSITKDRRQESAAKRFQENKEDIEKAKEEKTYDLQKDKLEKERILAAKEYKDVYAVAEGKDFVGSTVKEERSMGIMGQLFKGDIPEFSTKKERDDYVTQIEDSMFSDRLGDKKKRGEGIGDFGELKILERHSEELGTAFNKVTEETIEFVTAMKGLSDLFGKIKDKSQVNQSSIQEFMYKEYVKNTNQSTDIPPTGKVDSE